MQLITVNFSEFFFSFFLYILFHFNLLYFTNSPHLIFIFSSYFLYIPSTILFFHLFFILFHSVPHYSYFYYVFHLLILFFFFVYLSCSSFFIFLYFFCSKSNRHSSCFQIRLFGLVFLSAGKEILRFAYQYKIFSRCKRRFFKFIFL